MSSYWKKNYLSVVILTLKNNKKCIFSHIYVHIIFFNINLGVVDWCSSSKHSPHNTYRLMQLIRCNIRRDPAGLHIAGPCPSDRGDTRRHPRPLLAGPSRTPRTTLIERCIKLRRERSLTKKCLREFLFGRSFFYTAAHVGDGCSTDFRVCIYGLLITRFLSMRQRSIIHT